MSPEARIADVQAHLMKKRGEGDFAAQLAAYGDLGRLWRQQGAAARAAGNFEKAIQVAVHLERSDEMYSLYESLISAHKDAGDMDCVLDDYTMLLIYSSMDDDREKTSYFNRIRLDLVAQCIGNPNPSDEERNRFEWALESRLQARKKEKYRRLLKGEEEPTVPDQHVAACHFFLTMCIAQRNYAEALRYVLEFEQAMKRLGPWATPEGLESVQEMRRYAEQQLRERQ